VGQVLLGAFEPAGEGFARGAGVIGEVALHFLGVEKVEVELQAGFLAQDAALLLGELHGRRHCGGYFRLKHGSGLAGGQGHVGKVRLQVHVVVKHRGVGGGEAFGAALCGQKTAWLGALGSGLAQGIWGLGLDRTAVVDIHCGARPQRAEQADAGSGGQG